MKIGLGEWGFREIPIEKHAEIAANLGFRYLELGIGGNYPGRIQTDFSKEKINEIIKSIKDYGLFTPFMCIENDFTLSSEEQLKREVSRVCREIEFSAQFNAKYIRIFSGFSSPELVKGRVRDNMLEAIGKVAAKAKELSMSISIETHGKIIPKGLGVIHIHTTSTDYSCLKELIGELPDNVGFNFDPGNIKAVIDGDPIEHAKLLNHKINYCHLKDWIKLEDNTWKAAGVGDGTMDWKKVLGSITYDGVYLIEYEPTEDIFDGIERSKRYLDRNFETEY